MRTGRLLLINLLILLALIAVAGYGYWSWYQGYHFVSTSDAQVVAPLLSVSTPVPGTVSRIDVRIGQTVRAGQTLAAVTPVGSKTGATSLVTAPASGQVANISAPVGSSVTPGMPLLSLVRSGPIYIVANIPETRIRNVALGQTADVHVDAQPNTAFTGTVRAIQPATQSAFSLIPSAPSAGSFTKVTQRIPVYIRLDRTFGKSLADGMSAEIRIHIH